MTIGADVVSAIAAVAATLISSAAFGFAILASKRLRRSEQRSACFSLHQLWFSPTMMDARDHAADVLGRVASGDRPLSAFESDIPFQSSLSRVEHFVVDLGRLLDSEVVCRDLASALFSTYINSWVDLLEKAVYNGENKLSFHLGSSPEQAFREFRKNIEPVRRKLAARESATKLYPQVRSSA